MTTKMMEQKIESLQEQVSELRALVKNIIPEDSDGSYRAAFAKKMKKMAQEKSERIYEYSGKGSLLARMKK